MIPIKAFIFILSAFISTFLCTVIYFNDDPLQENHRISNFKYDIQSSLEKRDIIVGDDKRDLSESVEIDPKYLEKTTTTTEETHLNGNQTDSEDCFCDGENFCFQGLNADGKTVNGRKFDCSLLDGLKEYGLLDDDATNTTNDYDNLDDSWQPVFVTAASGNHFKESRKLIKSIHDNYPRSKIVVYDLGMKKSFVKEIKAWCNVEYHKFNFDNYPEHLRNLKNYAFKLVIVEAIQKYKTFFYFDASIRVEHKDLLKFLNGVKNNEILPFSTYTYVKHSVFATTHKGMFEFLPLPKIITQLYEIQSTFMFVSDSPYTRYILKWWYLCAMTEDCIAPEGSNVNCNLRKYHDILRTYVNCHRFDQAYWNIAALTYLFGEKRGAIKMGYVEEDWTELSENLVAQVENKRLKAMDPFFKLVTIRRNTKMNGRLTMKCEK